jgi:hypothetical protein
MAETPVCAFRYPPKNAHAVRKAAYFMSETRNYPAPPALPATLTELIAQRKQPIVRSLNDDVERIHLALWDHEVLSDNYRALLLPIWRPQCVEGSFPMDDSEAARLIRDYAKDHRMSIAARSNLQSIVHSLNVVKRRYRLDRKYRQNLLNGETVSGGGDDYAEAAE